VQVFDRQSLLLPQAAPAEQLGEQLGGRQVPAVQTFDPQSLLAPQVAPWLQVGEQLGGTHKLLLHVRE
jgi:hypothetical protein